MQVAARSGESGAYLFVLNLSREPRLVTLPAAYPSVLYGVIREGTLSLAPYGVDILRIS
ncbi:hypothetical protein HMSSN036_60740 [Paenibacillus macerans]|nr:hypothetical protein HMSSN036_60740 [Paenibacillus macerans]